jgi:hypothetical protein
VRSAGKASRADASAFHRLQIRMSNPFNGSARPSGAGRYQKLRERAFEDAWILAQMGLAPAR